jgi:hypothetical protein
MKQIQNTNLIAPVAAAITLLLSGCQGKEADASLPVVLTLEATEITTASALSGGVITDDGGAFVIERGICWDTIPQPTKVLPTKTTEGQDKGTFLSELVNLRSNQQYYARAWATNQVGTSYGNEISFQTDRKNSIVYKVDGRTVKYGDPLPIALDLTDDGQVDYTVFVELTAGNRGDRLYTGMNPIGENLIKSGPFNEENYLSMGFLVSENPGSLIDINLLGTHQWTDYWGALVIRNTSTNNQISYEGKWADPKQIVGIQHKLNGSYHFGWVRVDFDKETEVITLIDYAYDTIAGQPIIAGAREN